MQIRPYVALIAVLIIATICVIAATFRYISKKTARYVFIALLLVLFALCCFGLSLIIPDLKLRFFFHELKFLTLAFLAPCSLITYLEFTGRGRLLNKAAKLLLCVIPAATAVIALTNDYHHFFRREMYVVVHKGATYVASANSWWFSLYSVYSYLLYFCGVGVLTARYFRMPRIYRDQTGILVVTVVLAVAVGLGSALRLFPDYGDVSLVCCAVVCIAQYIAIVRYSKKRIMTQCRSLVFGSMSGYVLIYDHKDRLIDVSKASAFDTFRELDTSAFDENTGELRMPGSDECYSVSEKRIFDDKERPLGRVVLLSDITELRKAADELEYTATHDYLTGLPNKRDFHAALRGLVSEDLPAALIYACIPNIKLIVGIFGYEYGDRLIVQMADELRSISDTALCARLNGDEMGVLLKNTDAEGAEEFFVRAKERLFTDRADVRTKMIYTIVNSPDTDAGSVFALAAEALRRGRMSSSGHTIHKELMDMLSESVSKLRDGTGVRTEKVTSLCLRLADTLGLGDLEKNRLERLSVLADIGLLSADPALVQNIGNLTNEQWEEIKLHTVRGYSIALSARETEDIARDILSHHERYDGYGYPSGLRGKEIPITARIFSAVEFYFDAPPNRVRALLSARAGTQFDPEVARALLTLTEDTEI